MAASPRQIVLLHGRSYKPSRDRFFPLWLDAIRHGLDRDRPDALPAFAAATFEMAYYGDLSATWLDNFRHKVGDLADRYDEDADLADRRASIGRLKSLTRDDFTRSAYARMRGGSPLFELIADALEHPLRLLGLSESALQRYAPELAEYWADVHFGSDLRLVCTAALREAMGRDGEVALISHSLGTLIAYDVAWKLSHYGEYRHADWNRPIDLFVTLGGPLGNRTIRDRLKGATAPEPFRHPTNIRRWHNFTAEDDIIAHDQTLADDFADMPTPIVDHHIYNPAIRRGRVNPHYGAGYLMNPAFIELFADWLLSESMAE